MRLIREATDRNKRVVVLKSGRSKAGAKAAASHTGAIVLGSDLVFDSAIKQAGAIRAYTLETFFDLTRSLERFGPVSMKRNRIFLATFPGGEGVITTDFSEEEGLSLAEVEDTTVDRLRSVFPPWDIPANPWDLGLTTQFNNPNVVYQVIIEAMLDDPNVDALAIQLHPMVFLFPEEILKIFGSSVTGRKPIALWLAGMEPGRHKVLQSLEERGVLVFSSPEKAVRGLSALYRLSAQN